MFICETAAFSGTAPGEGSLENRMPKGEAMTAAAKMIRQKIGIRSVPPKSPATAFIKEDAALTVTAALRVKPNAVFVVLADCWSSLRCALCRTRRLACSKGRAAACPLATMDADFMVDLTAAAFCRVLGTNELPVGFSFGAKGRRGRSLFGLIGGSSKTAEVCAGAGLRSGWVRAVPAALCRAWASALAFCRIRSSGAGPAGGRSEAAALSDEVMVDRLLSGGRVFLPSAGLSRICSCTLGSAASLSSGDAGACAVRRRFFCCFR